MHTCYWGVIWAFGLICPSDLICDLGPLQGAALTSNWQRV